MTYEPVESRYVKGQPWVGATTFKFSSSSSYGAITAFDPISNNRKWINNEKYLATSGLLATAGNVVFYDAGDRWFKAVHALTGNELWRFQVSNPTIGNPFSYGHKGKQYIGIMTGLGGITRTSFWGDPIKVACSPGSYDNSVEAGFAKIYSLSNMCDFALKPTTLSDAGGVLHIFSL